MSPEFSIFALLIFVSLGYLSGWTGIYLGRIIRDVLRKLGVR
jgi:hypothetical protein